ncbi:MAG: hypothetical protein GEU80_04455 [Dehalococcoidia bacterium]|nr:hypothetical protein [Dehalococcoidia bacterium]
MFGDIAFGLVGLLFPLVVIGGIIAAIAAARRDDGPDEVDEPGIGTVRRVFLYGIALVALIFAGVGLSLLIGGALDAVGGDTVIGESDTGLAIGLSFTLVGVTAWLVMAFLAQRTVEAHAGEQRAQARRLCLALARGIALVIVMVNAVQAGRFLTGVGEFEGGNWGWLLVWAGIWVVHHRLVAAEPAPSAATRLIDRLYLYFASVAGLWTLLGGMVGVLEAPLSTAYDNAFRDSIIDGSWTEDVRTSAVVAAVGGAVWGWHWLGRLVRRDAITTLWRVYVYLFGVLTGVALVLGPATTILYDVLEWALRASGTSDEAAHFASVPDATALLVAGLATWAYHRVVLIEGQAGQAGSEPQRVYRYVLAAAGLVALAAGLTTLFALVLEALVRDEDGLFRQVDWWRSPLALGLTLLIVGGPLWARYWVGAQRATESGGAEERESLSRRVFLFGIFGVAVLVLLVNLTIVLYQVFEAVLDSTLSSAVIEDTRWSLAMVLTAGAVTVYYWLVLREDQAAAPEAAATPAARRREVVLIASGGLEDLARELERVEGVRVRLWRRLDAPTGTPPPALRAEELDALRAQVATADADRVAVIVTDGRYDVLPYAIADR